MSYIYILQLFTFEAVHPYHGKAYHFWVSWQYLYYSCTWYTGKTFCCTYFALRCIYAFERPSRLTVLKAHVRWMKVVKGR